MKTFFKFGPFIPITLFLLACTTAPQRTVAESDEASIREVVFAQMVDHWKHRKWPVTLFVMIGSEHADRAFLAEHSSLDAKILPASEYSHGAGVLCSIRGVTRISPTEAVVEGGYTYSLEGAEEGYFTVKFVNGRWLVTEWKVVTVS